MSHIIGDISVGKLADLVMWHPSNFGVRPDMVIKGGVIAWANVSLVSDLLRASTNKFLAQMGDANAVRTDFQFPATL